MFVNEANSNAQIRYVLLRIVHLIIFESQLDMSSVQLRICHNISDDRRQPNSDRCNRCDDNSPTAVKGKSYASFADWLSVDDSQKARGILFCTTLIGRLCVMFIGSAFPIGTLAKSLGVA
ncbi:hypothetical protein T11_16170 [Trichinella zimbabwensis]|uniref:Uncharacterized protein n=1 Tax=Trichinella zimbabwensis TaxID=268475 RepID=A0A0V1HXS3_9BILA|nr:hypothetical protein T11_16170 [Trichinella zimbabwensis]